MRPEKKKGFGCNTHGTFFDKISDCIQSMTLNAATIENLHRIREKESSIPGILSRANVTVQKTFNGRAEVKYVSEIGFFLAFAFTAEDNKKQQLAEISQSWPNLEFCCQTSSHFCFRNQTTKQLQQKLGDPARELVMLKDEVQRVLLAKIAEIVPEFSIIHEAIGELGVFINLALVACRLRFVRPRIRTGCGFDNRPRFKKVRSFTEKQTAEKRRRFRHWRLASFSPRSAPSFRRIISNIRYFRESSVCKKIV